MFSLYIYIYVFLQELNKTPWEIKSLASFQPDILSQGLKNSIPKPPAFADSFVCLANMSFWSALFFPCMAVQPHLGPRPAMWS